MLKLSKNIKIHFIEKLLKKSQNFQKNPKNFKTIFIINKKGFLFKIKSEQNDFERFISR
jgi:hypothetical protein